ncbi:MAG TPA: polynucleotide adenylyltransferase [Arcobacter sp.]|nr:polynucleotide adenylyltransferase [Arcobacter sp.]HIP56228.1 polynucleotide adenylyltransferase [Arcobacter sp.]
MIEKRIYKVGGCVRDSLLGIKYTDIDYVAVGYSEDDFKHLEKVGKDFPVYLNEKKEEIALARRERKEEVGYLGFSTSTNNVTIQEDLKRRDLTINSIAYDEIDEKYIDPYGGIYDIKNKILRHTSLAFIEDPLRVLRLARFQSKFPQFSIDISTKKLVYKMKNELKFLQKDRVYKELKKVFQLKSLELFFRTLKDLKVLEELFPNIYTLVKNGNFESTLAILKKITLESELLNYAVLYMNCNNKDIDIKIPVKIEKKVICLVNNKNILQNIKYMKIDDIVLFFESYKKNKILFEEQIRLYKICNTKKNINTEKLYIVFNKISNYSPLVWINNQENIPNGKDIKEHIHKVNIEIISYNLLYV